MINEGRAMSREVSVSTSELESALGYLEGLSLILRTLDTEKRGRDGADPLVSELQRMPDALYEWSPMHHQGTSGQGWSIVDHNLQALRDRLAKRYADATADSPSDD